MDLLLLTIIIYTKGWKPLIIWISRQKSCKDHFEFHTSSQIMNERRSVLHFRTDLLWKLQSLVFSPSLFSMTSTTQLLKFENNQVASNSPRTLNNRIKLCVNNSAKPVGKEWSFIVVDYVVTLYFKTCEKLFGVGFYIPKHPIDFHLKISNYATVASYESFSETAFGFQFLYSRIISSARR